MTWTPLWKCWRCRRKLWQRRRVKAALERARLQRFAVQLEHVRELKLALGQRVHAPLEFPSVPTYRRFH